MSSRMKSFAKAYLRVLFFVLLGMGAYHLSVVPWIEPESKSAPPIPEYARILGGQRWWESLFADGAWQLDNPTIVQNARGVLLASSWEQIGPKSWKLQPISMILPQSDRHARSGPSQRDFSQQDVWIVSAEQGAVIHFEEPFDLRSGSVPSVERGQLDGLISITRRSVNKPNERQWSLTTSDLSIDRRRISTQQSVSIRWDGSIIRGRDLRIMLRRDVLGGGQATEDENAAWGPLDELELYHVEELRVALPAGGLWAGMNPSLLKHQAATLQMPAVLQASCGGRFAFDFKDSTAALTNGVRIWHQLGQLPPDEFLAHKVTLQVAPPSSADLGPNAVAMGGIKIKEFIALGIDSLQDFIGEQWVDLKLPNLDAAARAKRLRIDVEQQRIELAGKLEHAGATQSVAWINFQGHELRSPAIEYQAAPLNAQRRASHAGWMFAEGPGELNMSAASQMGATQVRWQRSLKMAPTENAGEQWLELSGNTLVESKSQGLMTAERLQVWLKQWVDLPPATSASTSAGRDTLRPDRILATGNTMLATTNLHAHVGTLAVQMVYAPAADAPAQQQPSGLELSDSQGNPMFAFVSPPSQQARSPAALGAAASNPDAHRQPVKIYGQALKSTVVSSGPQTWIDALTMDGPVKIESGATMDTNLPWHIDGDQLVLATNPAGQIDMQISGQPARIVVADGALEGPAIRFDQRNNLVWMDQPGEFTIPPSVINGQNAMSPGLQWVRAPRCQWTGRLLFDGSMARIEGDIQFDGVARQVDELWMLKGFCQRLDLALAAPLDLQGSSSPTRVPGPPATSAGATSASASVERIVLQENVDIRVEQRDLQGNPQSTERIVVPVLTFHVANQKLVGGGPGWLHSKFLSQASGLGQFASQGTATKQSLQGAHLMFRDSLVAFLDRREVVIDGKVVLAAGPLASWNDTIDIASMTQLQIEQMLLNCDQLKVLDTSGMTSTASLTAGTSSKAMELQATGNVDFEGKAESGTYAGKGYQVTYVQAKDHLTVRGDGHTPALLVKIPNNPQAEGKVSAYVTEATINLRTLAIPNLQFSHAQLEFQPAINSAPGTFSPGDNLPVAPPNPRANVGNFFQPAPNRP